MWGPHEIPDTGNYTYVAHLDAPGQGWAGFLIEVEFTGKHSYVSVSVPPWMLIASFTFPPVHHGMERCGITQPLPTDTGGANLLDPMKVTTEVSIIPKTLPYPPCGKACDQVSCATVDST